MYRKTGRRTAHLGSLPPPCILQIVHSVEEAPAQALDIQLLIDVVATQIAQES